MTGTLNDSRMISNAEVWGSIPANVSSLRISILLRTKAIGISCLKKTRKITMQNFLGVLNVQGLDEDLNLSNQLKSTSSSTKFK